MEKQIEELAKELFGYYSREADNDVLDWDDREENNGVRIGFIKISKFVLRREIEARIDEVYQYGDARNHPLYIKKRVSLLEIQLNQLDQPIK